MSLFSHLPFLSCLHLMNEENDGRGMTERQGIESWREGWKQRTLPGQSLLPSLLPSPTLEHSRRTKVEWMCEKRWR